MSRSFAVFVALGLMIGPSASAQVAAGYSGSPGVIALPDSDLWIAIRQMGLCLVQTKGGQSRALLATQPRSPEESRLVRDMVGRGTSCLRFASRARFGTNFLRGAIAEALYRREFTGPPPAVPLASTPFATDVATDLSSFATCFVAAKPDVVHGLLVTTRLGSSEELELISGLAADFGVCLPREPVRLESQTTRAAFAEALYQRSLAAPDAAVRGN